VRRKAQSLQSFKVAVAALMMTLLLALFALAASPSLHQYFHHDAGSTEHSCAITLFAHGKLMATGEVPVMAVFVSLLLLRVPLARLAEFSSYDLRLGFGRAPPVSVSSQS
jgi:hypothetical protein